MIYELRPYQVKAVDCGVEFLQDEKKKYNGIEVLPTGSGKSLVIANIAKKLGKPTLVFQPSKEILEQNHAKYLSYGNQAAIYSASAGRKEISNVTFATIGSVRSKPDLFNDFEYIIVDECHFVNSKSGMYNDFLRNNGAKVLGLTATPYRLTTDGYGGSILKFLTRTRPRIFREVVYYVQNGQLFNDDHLAKLRYAVTEFDRSKLRLNTTGADFSDQSVKNYYKQSGFPDRIAKTINYVMESRRNALVFTRFIEEAEYLTGRVNGSAIVTGKTPKKEREKIINGFKQGDIKVVCNVGVLTTGFDYPELETVILARPTMSLALYYQMIGRGIRPHPDKENTLIVDMCGNSKMFGRVEDLKIVDGQNGKWFISSRGRQLTNVYYGEIPQTYGKQA